MKFLSVSPSSSLLLFISFLGFSHFSSSLSPPNSRFSLEDQFSKELAEDDQTESTTVYPMQSSESGLDNQSGDNVTLSKPDPACECGIRGESDSFPFSVKNRKKWDVSLQQPLILNGSSVSLGELPWIAALTRYNTHAAPRVICSASLITPNILVSAAHCIIGQRKDRLRIVFNALHISPQSDVRKNEKAIIMKIKHLYPHPEFDPVTVDNDIGLIELEKPLDFVKMKDIIRIVCLPPSQSTKDYAGVQATVAGWGYTKADGFTNSPSLLKADVPIWSNEACQKTEYGNEILPGMLCAGFEHGGTDACTNDSGGPLTVQENGKDTLVGLVSWGNSCGLPNVPGVYTRVTSYVNWIQKQIKGASRCIH